MERPSVQNVKDEFEVEDGLTQHFEVLKELGDCYAALGELDAARQCYQDAIGLDPAQAAPHVGLGVLAIQENNHAAAELAFQGALALNARCGEAFGGLAMLAQQKQQYPQALELYLKCLELDSDNLVALLGLFQTSCQMGTFGKIIHYLELYLQRHPGDTSVQFCLATLYGRDGRLQEARTMLQNVLTLEPEKVEAAALLKEVEGKMAQVA